MKPRIAIIIPGGIGTGRNNIGVPVLERIVKILSKDFEITVFSLFKINDNYRQDDFELVSINGSPFVKAVKFLFIFIRNHHKKKFSVVHGFWAMPSGFFAVVMGKILGIRSFVSILGGDAISLPDIHYGQLQRWLPRQLILWTLNHATEVISLTQYLIDNLRIYGFTRAVKIIPWGIDTNNFRFREKKLVRPIQFLHIGNLNHVKDQTTLLKAFKIIRDNIDSRLTIIGEGVLQDKTKSLAHELRLNDSILFLELQPYDKLPEYYAKANVLLHTSRSEGQSEVVTEAMSCGVVVCGTRVGLLYDQPSCCISVPVGDYALLANEVLMLLTNSPKFNSIREHAFAWASEHSIHWTTSRLSELYLEETSSNVEQARL